MSDKPAAAVDWDGEIEVVSPYSKTFAVKNIRRLEDDLWRVAFDDTDGWETSVDVLSNGMSAHGSHWYVRNVAKPSPVEPVPPKWATNASPEEMRAMEDEPCVGVVETVPAAVDTSKPVEVFYGGEWMPLLNPSLSPSGTHVAGWINGDVNVMRHVKSGDVRNKPPEPKVVRQRLWWERIGECVFGPYLAKSTEPMAEVFPTDLEFTFADGGTPSVRLVPAEGGD